MRSRLSHRRLTDDGVLVSQRCACIHPWSRIITVEPASCCRLIPNSCRVTRGCRGKQALARGSRRCHHLRWGCETVTREGHQIFTNELTRFARRAGDSRISAIADELASPLGAAGRGREGVGRATVAAALAATGLEILDEGAAADVDVVVVAEALKPEDQAMLSSGPSLVVLTKADLAGFGAGGPIAVADRRAAAIQSLTGVPTVSMVGLLAVAALDDDLVAALRTLTAEPADLTSTDGFSA